MVKIESFVKTFQRVHQDTSRLSAMVILQSVCCFDVLILSLTSVDLRASFEVHPTKLYSKAVMVIPKFGRTLKLFFPVDHSGSMSR